MLCYLRHQGWSGIQRLQFSTDIIIIRNAAGRVPLRASSAVRAVRSSTLAGSGQFG